MIDGPFGLAFAAGMVATFNPCGFAMLPAYLAYYLGEETDRSDGLASVKRALLTSAVLTAGFVLVFSVTGALISWTSVEIRDRLPWITMVIGIVLVALGVALLAGKHLALSLPRLERGAEGRGLGSMLAFGASYAIASLSCTIGPFLAVAGTLYTEKDVISGTSLFVVYGLGMGLVLSVLTIAIALTRTGLVARLRRAMPVIHRLSGGLLVLAGTYLTWYGWFERSADPSRAGPAQLFWDLNSDFNNWVQDVGAVRLGLVLAGLVVIAVVMAWGWRASLKPFPQKAPAATETESERV